MVPPSMCVGAFAITPEVCDLSGGAACYATFEPCTVSDDTLYDVESRSVPGVKA